MSLYISNKPKPIIQIPPSINDTPISSSKKQKTFIIFSIYLNSTLSLLDRLLQIIFYSTVIFNNNNIKSSTLMYILLKPICLISIYVLNLFFTLSSKGYFQSSIGNSSTSFKTLSKQVFFYIFSQEICFWIGIQYSIMTNSYSLYTDSPIVPCFTVNLFHVFLVSIPQIIISIVNSSANEMYDVISVLSILFSFMFFIWNIVFFSIYYMYMRSSYEKIFKEILYD